MTCINKTSSHQYQVKTQFKVIKDLQATKQAVYIGNSND